MYATTTSMYYPLDRKSFWHHGENFTSKCAENINKTFIKTGMNYYLSSRTTD